MAMTGRDLGLKTIAEYPVEEVLEAVSQNAEKEYSVDGVVYHVKMRSVRYYTFKKGLKCVCCGLEGTKFKLELHKYRSPTDQKRRAHFNLYGVEDDIEIMLTKDHRRPRSLGGKDRLSNLQTMCMICNNLKQDRVVPMDWLRKKRRDWSMSRKAGKVKKYRLERYPAIGYYLLQIEPDETGMRTKRIRIGVFLGPTAKEDIAKYLGVKSISYCVVGEEDSLKGNTVGVWPIFKLAPVRAHRPYAWQQDYEDKSDCHKIQYLGSDIMGWSKILLLGNDPEKEEHNWYWWTGLELFRLYKWNPLGNEHHSLQLVQRIRELGMEEAYEKRLQELVAKDQVTPRTVCSAIHGTWEHKKTADLNETGSAVSPD